MVGDGGSRHRSRGWRIAVATALLALACGGDRALATDPEPDGDVLWSLLAVGDTGGDATPWLPNSLQRVTAGLDAVARTRPVDAVVLLGDNFYPSGLERHELAARVRMNVVAPLCRFADLSAPRSPEVEDACAILVAERRPVPIFAVLGNHDYRTDASPSLQIHAVPEFVANWEMPEDTIRVHAVAPGVSLVLFHSMPMVQNGEDVVALERALRDAPGPWRILAAHHPVLATKGDHNELEDRHLTLAREAIRAAGVPVQLALGGHHHSLQLLVDEAPAMPVQVVSGSGSRSPEAVVGQPGLRFASQRSGFARIDLVERDGEQRLVVSFYSTRSPWLPPAAPHLEARWSVDRGGLAHEVIPGPVP